jgi:RNA polymerase sigma factor (sigma-70 family)
MQRPCAHTHNHHIDFETLYLTYWKRVVQFCAKSLATLPEGTAEEVAQDVFLAAYEALASDRYRGEGAISSWLLGIARNLCSKMRRDTYRKSTSRRMRQLEREIEQLERDLTRYLHDETCLDLAHVCLRRERLSLARTWLERERELLYRHVLDAAHTAPPQALDTLADETPFSDVQASLRHFARRDRQAYTLLHMHVVKDTTVQEIAALQGMSRSAVYRSLSRAKAELRTMVETRMAPSAS